MSAVSNDLKAGFEILWYQVESVLGRGGFGITYLAKDNNLGQLVAIKEYLPHEFAERSGDSTVQPVSIDQEDVFSWGLERFMSEAQTLAKFKHPNIVRVLSVFKHNNTGYMVMEYEQGEDLSTRYKRSIILSQKELEGIYYPIIDGLASVHKEGFIHRDIKPANIYIRSDGSPVLIDFGAARQAVGSKTKTLTSMLSIGYAPFEQYNDASGGKQGPWTDIYALGASLHQAITGAKPMESTIRAMSMLHDEPDPYKPLTHLNIEGYSHSFLRAIDQALMLQIYDRPQNLEDFLALLKGELTLPELPKVPEKVSEATIIRPGKRTFSGSDVSQRDPKTISETIALTKVDKPETELDVNSEIDFELTPEPDPAPKSTASPSKDTAPDAPSTSKGLSISPKLIIAMVGVVVVILAILVFLPGEQTPEDIRQQNLDNLIAKANEQVSQGNLYNQSGNGAYSIYKQALGLDPENSEARVGVNSIAEHYLLDAEKSIDNKDFTQANDSLKIVKLIDPKINGIEKIQSRFAENFESEKKFKQLELLLSQANAALEKGNNFEPEQKSALYYFQNVLKIDPDNVTAKLGLLKTADTILAEAKSAISKNDPGRAEKLVKLAESIDPEKAEIQMIRAQIDEKGELQELLSKADDAYAKSRYTSPESDNAYTHYKKLLELAPNNKAAQQGLDNIANYYREKAQEYTRAGNISSANLNLDSLETHFPDDAAISSLRRDIGNKQRQIDAAKATAKPPVKVVTRPKINPLLPSGINQKQDDYQVVQDIVGLFINAFKAKDMNNLLKVSQLNSQQQGLYATIFKSYQSLNIKVVPNSFTLSKKDGIASVKFEIVDLINTDGNQVVTSANWTKIELKIAKMSGNWEKASVI